VTGSKREKRCAIGGGMSLESLFQLLSFAPGPFWLLILFLPGNRHAMLAVDGFLVLLAGVFTVLTIPVVPDLLPLLAEPEFSSIRAFLGTELGFVGSWNHMILGDLWIGRWVARDSLRGGKPLLVRLLFLPPILFFGPLGAFLYLVFRMISRRRFSLTDAGRGPDGNHEERIES